MYLGGMLNGTPTQYVQFSAAGIKIHSPAAVVLEAPTCKSLPKLWKSTPAPAGGDDANFHGQQGHGPEWYSFGAGGGAATFSGSMTVDGDVTAQGTSVHNHVHRGVQPGGGKQVRQYDTI